MNRRGQPPFIVIEGIDGSGTTTHASLLARYLAGQGRSAHSTQEPSSGPIGSLIRLALRRRIGSAISDGSFAPLDEVTMALAFAADRADHLHNEVLPALAAGQTVVSDRYYLSSLAYQSAGADYAWLRAVNAHFRRPDLTVFLDLSPEASARRMEADARGGDLYESVERLAQVRAGYLRAVEDLRAEGERIITLSSERPVDDVHADIVRLVEGLPAFSTR